jgi:hypothetical protein
VSQAGPLRDSRSAEHTLGKFIVSRPADDAFLAETGLAEPRNTVLSYNNDRSRTPAEIA